jgi:hypothetical protein
MYEKKIHYNFTIRVYFASSVPYQKCVFDNLDHNHRELPLSFASFYFFLFQLQPTPVVGLTTSSYTIHHQLGANSFHVRYASLISSSSSSLFCCHCMQAVKHEL